MLWSLLLPLLWAGEWGQGQELGVQGQGNSHISVGSLAWGSRYQLTVPESVTTQEGLCTLVYCSVFYLTSVIFADSVFGYWFLEGANANQDSPVATNNPDRPVQTETKGRFYLLGNPKVSNCSLLIKDLQESDTGVYFFRVETGIFVKYSYMKNNLFSVGTLALTQTPDFQVPMTLETGHTAHLICSVPWAYEGGTPPVFTWMTVAFTSLTVRDALSSVLSRGRALWDRPRLLSACPERQVLHSNSSLRVQEGESLRLVCMADSNTPATLNWTKVNLTSGFVHPSTPEVLQLEDHGDYVCRAQNSLGTQDASVNLSVRSPLQLLGPSRSWEAEGLHCGCSFRAWPAPSLHWRLGEGLLGGNSSNASFTVTSSSTGPWANSSLSLHGVFSSNLRLSCEAQNDLGAQRGTVLLVEGPLSLLLAGKPEASVERIQRFVMGDGIMVLLAVCLCLIFIIVKLYRRKSALKLVSQEVGHLAKNPVSMVNDAHVSPRRVSVLTRQPRQASDFPGCPLFLLTKLFST
uniref:Ig-like domain-containing protein n=1 Tax=Nannospalax galili TaxID=1026970 RepID=A0A8C6R0G0_NANGA